MKQCSQTTPHGQLVTCRNSVLTSNFVIVEDKESHCACAVCVCVCVCVCMRVGVRMRVGAHIACMHVCVCVCVCVCDIENIFIARSSSLSGSVGMK